jgi:chaperone required for assembly of F1-ATPase
VGAEAAFAAAALDDLWSQERWGEDEEVRKKLNQLRADLDSLGEFLSALEAP